LRVLDLARAVAQDYAKALGDKKLAHSKTVYGVQWLARADRRHAAVVEQWDCDPWLLNTPSGTVELLKGLLRAHGREDYLTKITGAEPGGPCPQWQKFLARIMADDGALISYLQRVAGYCLTGSTREHALFFCYGTGANGKGVFVNTLKACSATMPPSRRWRHFLPRKETRHPTDLARLRGARLVTAQETTDGGHWDETKIKALTGGDPIAARFMRQDFFTYTPEFKLLIAGNHKPGLRSVDEAMRRRLNLIPFNVTIPKGERDPDLAGKLNSEWPGILQWAIDGCRAWQQQGLDPPPTVVEATAAYLEEDDAITRWIEEKCAADPCYVETVANLFASWKVWSEAAAEHTGSTKRFSQALEDRGFKRHREGAASDRGFRGIALRPYV
jgi:putative DNA primase/helicase